MEYCGYLDVQPEGTNISAHKQQISQELVTDMATIELRDAVDLVLNVK